MIMRFNDFNAYAKMKAAKLAAKRLYFQRRNEEAKADPVYHEARNETARLAGLRHQRKLAGVPLDTPKVKPHGLKKLKQSSK